MLLEVSGLTTRYGSISALRDVSLSVGAGEVIGLIGPDGAGKTTLLDTVAGLLSPAAGTVVFDGVDVGGAAPEQMLSGSVVGHGAGTEVLFETDLFDTFVRGSAP